MDEQKIHHILMDALKAANAKCDSDGSTIWIDTEDRRTLAVCVSECAPDDCGRRDKDKETYLVSLHAEFTGVFNVKASSESEAEAIIRNRFDIEEIGVDDLELVRTTVGAAQVE